MFQLIRRLFSRFKSEQQITDTLYVGNLVYSANNSDLIDAFSQFGRIENARIIRDNRTHRSKGFGFVTFARETAAKEALAMEGCEIKGRPIRVRFAHVKTHSGRH